MVLSANDIEIHLTGGSTNTDPNLSLGGNVSTTQVNPDNIHNLFRRITDSEASSGVTLYRCVAIKNGDDLKTMMNAVFYMVLDTASSDDLALYSYAQAAKNTIETTVATEFTAPTGSMINFIATRNRSGGLKLGDLAVGEYICVWLRITVNPNALPFNENFFKMRIEVDGSGVVDTTNTDIFGIRKIYATDAGGRVYNSNWHTATSHQWDATGGQVPHANKDPQDSMADLISPSTCRAIVDGNAGTLTADTNADRNSWRYYILDPATTPSSSPWKWSETLESTIYYKAISDYSGGSIHVHCRLMSATEHWNAIPDDNVNACPAGGHEYSFEIKQDKSIQLKKEMVHPAYADNKIATISDAPYNKWIGMKLVTQKRGGKMRVEGWRDLTDGLNGGKWDKVVSFIDDGTNWKMSDSADVTIYNGVTSGVGSNCVKITPKERMLDMNGSAVGIRCDNTKVIFKKYSVREIDQDDVGIGGGTGEPPDEGGGGPVPPPTDTGVNFTMATLADTSCSSDFSKNLSKIKGRNVGFVVFNGDNAYKAGEKCFIDAVNNAGYDKAKSAVSFGNHDVDEGSDANGSVNALKNNWGLSKTYYSRTFHNVGIVIMEGGENESVSSSGGAGSTETISRKVVYAPAGFDTDSGSFDANNTYLPTEIIIHEMMNSITDPDWAARFGPDAWYDPATGDDFMDSCGATGRQYGTGVNSYWVPGYWSNSDNSCVVPHYIENDLGSSTKMKNPSGGTPFKNAKIYIVFWGTVWRDRVTDPTTAGIVDRIKNRLLGTDNAYFAKLNQYSGIQTPTWGDSAVNYSYAVPSGHDIPESAAKKMLINTFETGLLPPPSNPNQNIYILIPPPFTRITYPNADVAPNGFHDIMNASMTVPVSSGGGAQFNAIKGFLQSFKNNSAIEWIFVFNHYPIYGPSSNHGNDSGVRDDYDPIFDQYGVDAVFTGHNHIIFHTKLLKYNSGSPGSPTATGTDPNYSYNRATTNHGKLYFGSGAGGKSHYSISGSNPSYVPYSNDSKYAYLLMEFSNNGKKCTFKFYDNSDNLLKTATLSHL